MGMAAKTISTAVRPCMPKGAFSRAFRCKNEQHVAHGDDGFNKQNDADPAWDTPRHERQYGQSRHDVTNTLEAKHQAMLAPSSGSGRPKLRVAVVGLTTYWVPIAIIARATSNAIPSASQCITLSYSSQER
jgi:hypothetical protein